MLSGRQIQFQCFNIIIKGRGMPSKINQPYVCASVDLKLTLRLVKNDFGDRDKLFWFYSTMGLTKSFIEDRDNGQRTDFNWRSCERQK